MSSHQGLITRDLINSATLNLRAAKVTVSDQQFPLRAAAQRLIQFNYECSHKGEIFQASKEGQNKKMIGRTKQSDYGKCRRQ